MYNTLKSMLPRYVQRRTLFLKWKNTRKWAINMQGGQSFFNRMARRKKAQRYLPINLKKKPIHTILYYTILYYTDAVIGYFCISKNNHIQFEIVILDEEYDI